MQNTVKDTFTLHDIRFIGANLLFLDSVQCIVKVAYFYFALQPNIRDKLTALEARLTVQLPTSRADLSPVLGLASAAAEMQSLTGLPQDISLVARDSVIIQKDCGEDNLCVPDLRLTYSR
jgi:hypothetical protein